MNLSKITKKPVDRIKAICYDGIWRRNNSKILKEKNILNYSKVYGE